MLIEHSASLSVNEIPRMKLDATTEVARDQPLRVL
jgi:hypothetical protein